MKYLIERIILDSIKLFFSTGIIFILASMWVDDGNIWSIYIAEGHLVIGDFWAGMIITYLLWSSIEIAKDIWFYGKQIKEKIQE